MIQDVALVLEVAIEGAMAYAQAPGDISDGGLVIAALGKLGESRLDNVRPQLQAVAFGTGQGVFFAHAAMVADHAGNDDHGIN